MPNVRTLRRHENAYPPCYVKQPRRVYEHPHPELLVANGLVEVVPDSDASAPEDPPSTD